MDKMVTKAKIIMEFEEGVNLNTDTTIEEALQVLSEIANDGEVKVKLEFEDGSDLELTRDEDEEDDEDDEDDED
jgi:hypothetical protein